MYALSRWAIQHLAKQFLNIITAKLNKLDLWRSLLRKRSLITIESHMKASAIKDLLWSRHIWKFSQNFTIMWAIAIKKISKYYEQCKF